MRQVEAVQSFAELQAVYDTLQHLEAEYPGFCDWYWQKVVPGLAEGTRQVLIRRENGDIAGVSIARLNAEGPKLCTLWVDARYASMGTGSELFEQAKAWMGTDTPMFTVAEERLGVYRWMLRRTSAKLVAVENSLYRPGAREFVFNGIQEPKGKCPRAPAMELELAN